VPYQLRIKGCIRQQQYNEGMQATVRAKLTQALKGTLKINRVKLTIDTTWEEDFTRQAGKSNKPYGVSATHQKNICTGDVLLEVVPAAGNRVCDLYCSAAFGGKQQVAGPQGGTCRMEVEFSAPLGEEEQGQLVYLVHPAFPGLSTAQMLSVLFRAVTEACLIGGTAERYKKWMLEFMPNPTPEEAVFEAADLMRILDLVQGRRTPQGHFVGVMRNREVFERIEGLNQMLVIPTWKGPFKAAITTVPMEATVLIEDLPLKAEAGEALRDFRESEICVEVKLPVTSAQREEVPKGVAFLKLVALQLQKGVNKERMVCFSDGTNQQLTPGGKLLAGLKGDMHNHWKGQLQAPFGSFMTVQGNPMGAVTCLEDDTCRAVVFLAIERRVDAVKLMMLEQVTLEYTGQVGGKQQMKARVGIRSHSFAQLIGGQELKPSQGAAERKTWALRMLQAMEQRRLQRVQWGKKQQEKGAAAEAAAQALEEEAEAKRLDTARTAGGIKVRGNPMGDMGGWDFKGGEPPPEIEQYLGASGGQLILHWAALKVPDRMRMARIAKGKVLAQQQQQQLELTAGGEGRHPPEQEQDRGGGMDLTAVRVAAESIDLDQLEGDEVEDEGGEEDPLGPMEACDFEADRAPLLVVETLRGSPDKETRLLEDWSKLTAGERRKKAVRMLEYKTDMEWASLQREVEVAEVTERGGKAQKSHRGSSPARGEGGGDAGQQAD
jgi:hypothetical protein